jgi:transcriptional regulator with XRE-family HTH domain
LCLGELTQSELAALVGVSQSRISQIESRVKVDKITFDVLLSILQAMGFGFSISTKKLREPDLESTAA